MQYYLCIYVTDYEHAEPYHETGIVFDTLEEAETIYNQFDGKEIFDEQELEDELAEIKYIIKIHGYHNENIVSFVKAKYKTLDLESFYPDFWKFLTRLKPTNLHFKKFNFR